MCVLLTKEYYNTLWILQYPLTTTIPFEYYLQYPVNTTYNTLWILLTIAQVLCVSTSFWVLMHPEAGQKSFFAVSEQGETKMLRAQNYHISFYYSMPLH